MKPKNRLAMLQMMAAAMMSDNPLYADNLKHPKDNSAQSTMPTFKVNGMFIQAVNEQAAQAKYDKIISKRNRKQKQ